MLVPVAVVIAIAVGAGGTLLALRLLAGSRLEAARRTRALLLDEARSEAESTRRAKPTRPVAKRLSRRASRRSSCGPSSRRNCASVATR